MGKTQIDPIIDLATHGDTDTARENHSDGHTKTIQTVPLRQSDAHRKIQPGIFQPNIPGPKQILDIPGQGKETASDPNSTGHF